MLDIIRELAEAEGLYINSLLATVGEQDAMKAVAELEGRLAQARASLAEAAAARTAADEAFEVLVSAPRSVSRDSFLGLVEQRVALLKEAGLLKAPENPAADNQSDVKSAELTVAPAQPEAVAPATRRPATRGRKPKAQAAVTLPEPAASEAVVTAAEAMHTLGDIAFSNPPASEGVIVADDVEFGTVDPSPAPASDPAPAPQGEVVVELNSEPSASNEAVVEEIATPAPSPAARAALEVSQLAAAEDEDEQGDDDPEDWDAEEPEYPEPDDDLSHLDDAHDDYAPAPEPVEDNSGGAFEPEIEIPDFLKP